MSSKVNIRNTTSSLNYQPIVSKPRAGPVHGMAYPEDDVTTYEYDGSSGWSKHSANFSSTLQHVHLTHPRIVFATFDTISQQPSLKQAFTQFGVPPFLWSKASAKSSGFTGSMASIQRSGSANKSKAASWYRFIIKQTYETDTAEIKYYWYEMTFLALQLASGASLMFCLDTPEYLQIELMKKLQEQTTLYEPDHFSIQALVIEVVVDLYDISVWSNRDILRNIETRRSTSASDFADMNDMLRHIMHTTEVLHVASDTCNKIAEDWKNLIKLERGENVNNLVLPSQDALTALTWLPTLLNGFEHRSRSNESRLQNEINLVAQQDNQTTGMISMLTYKDSSAMKTVSFVTLAFLPATFVSTIFSMSFFNFSPNNNNNNNSQSNGGDEWRVSDQFWIYWAITGPLTLITIGLWLTDFRLPSFLRFGKKENEAKLEITHDSGRMARLQRRITNFGEKRNPKTVVV